jgi:hypothetical protein
MNGQQSDLVQKVEPLRNGADRLYRMEREQLANHLGNGDHIFRVVCLKTFI